MKNIYFYHVKTSEKRNKEKKCKISSSLEGIKSSLSCEEKRGFFVLEKSAPLSLVSLSTKEEIFLFKCLEISLKSGLTLRDAVKNLKDGNNIKICAISDYIQERLSEGEAFYKIIQSFPLVFDNYSRIIIESAEMSGDMLGAIQKTQKLKEKRRKTSNSIIGAVIYPSIISSFALILLSLIFFYIIPTVKDNLEIKYEEIPTMSKFFFGVSDFLCNNLSLFLVSFSFLVFSVAKMYSSGKLFKLCLKIPAFRNVILFQDLSMSFYIISQLTSNKVNVIDAMKCVRNVSCISEVRTWFDEVIESLSKGSDNCWKQQDLIPSFTKIILKTGIQEGNVQQASNSIEEFFSSESERMISILISVINPIFIVVLGLIIGMTAVSVLMPMTSFNI